MFSYAFINGNSNRCPALDALNMRKHCSHRKTGHIFAFRKCNNMNGMFSLFNSKNKQFPNKVYVFSFT